MISIVSPVYNEKDNIEKFCSNVRNSMIEMGTSWELVLIDDHSNDSTIDIIRQISEDDSRIKYYRLAKNEGSHVAIAAGISYAKGDCAIIMASDLQDDPSDILKLINYWKQGFQSVWLVRDTTEGGYSPSIFGKVWYKIVRRLPGLSTMPAMGADMFLIDRKIIEALGHQNLRKVAVPLLIRSMGFRQINLTYKKNKRVHGKSSWTLKRKIIHVVNTILAFTNIPIRIISILGFSMSILSFLYACFLLIHKLIIGESVSGWHSLMVFNSLAFSMIMLVIGILGEYIWRTFELVRGPSVIFIEDSSVHDNKDQYAA